MSRALHRALALWAALLIALVCLVFLPLALWPALALMLAGWGLIIATLYMLKRRAHPQTFPQLAQLPEAAWRLPVVLVCGDAALLWPADNAVIVDKEGCWIRAEANQNIAQLASQLLQLRPQWSRQLTVMINVCPQQHSDAKVLASYLLLLRWQISQLRREAGHAIPLILTGQIGSAMIKEIVWQAALPGEPIRVWHAAKPPCSVAAWASAAGAEALAQQVLFSSLMAWFDSHVLASFSVEHPDIATVTPMAVLWRLGPSLEGALSSSLWQQWLLQHTALKDVAGWMPATNAMAPALALPSFILPLLPKGQGLTAQLKAVCYGLTFLLLAAFIALCSSGWNNHRLLQRLIFDLNNYQRIAMDDYQRKAQAVAVLRQDALELNHYARHGAPLRLGLGLYQGTQLHAPLLAAIHAYVPPPPPPPPEPKPAPAPQIIRLDSLSLFDSGKSLLKAGSTKLLVNSLVDIKGRPGWLIVVSGHTDNTGNVQQNQVLSLKRAEAVRDWMRDTGGLPESCFAVQGYGDSQPIASNETAQGRAANRRVEIMLVPQADACRVPQAPNRGADESVPKS